MQLRAGDLTFLACPKASQDSITMMRKKIFARSAVTIAQQTMMGMDEMGDEIGQDRSMELDKIFRKIFRKIKGSLCVSFPFVHNFAHRE